MMIQNEPEVSETIFVIEDDDELLSRIEKKLTSEKIKVDGAATGHDAIAKINRDVQTLLLLDYDLPDMTGDEFVLCLHETGHQTPFIVMISQSEKGVLPGMMRLGAIDYIMKDTYFIDLLVGVVTRVIKQIRTEDLLERTEKNLREILRRTTRFINNLPGMAYRSLPDDERTIIFKIGSAKLTDLFPSDLNDDKHVSYMHLIDKLDRRRVLETINTAVGKREPFEMTYRIHTRTGEEKWVLETGSGIFSTNGELKAVEGFIMDITEHKKAEINMRRLTRGIESANDAIMITDIDGAIQYINPAFIKLTDYTESEVLGKTPVMLWGGKTRSYQNRDMWDTILRREVWTGEITDKRKDGTLYDAELTISPIVDHNRMLEGFVCVQKDITERKQMEAALRESERQYRNMFNLSLDGICIITPEGTILDCNPAMSVILGYMREEVIGKSLAYLLHHDQLEDMQEFRRQIDNFGEVRMETVFVHKFGAAIMVKLEGMRFIYAGRPALMGIIHDITEHKQMEEELKRLTSAISESNERITL